MTKLACTAFALTFIGICAALPALAGDESIQFAYSSLKEGDCRAVSGEEGSSIESCPGFGGYDIQVSSGDSSSNLSVFRGKKEVLAGPSVHNTTVRRQIVEWRYRGATPVVTALIFRMDEQGGPKVKSTLYVARFIGRPCIVGKTGSNAAARAMADDPSRPCR